MKTNQFEKQQRFAFRKLSVGLVSAMVASLIFASAVINAPAVSAQSIHYSYVTEQELTDAEKELIIRELPRLAQATDANYYLVYRPVGSKLSSTTMNIGSSSKVLPKTGALETSITAIAGLSLLVIAFKLGRKGKKEVAGVVLLIATGTSFLVPTASALTNHILSQFNQMIEITSDQALPAPADIEGYVYVGYIKGSSVSEQPPSVSVTPPTPEEPIVPVAPPATEEPTAPVVPPTPEEPTAPVVPPTPEEPTDPVTPPTTEEPTEPVTPPTPEEPTDPVTPPTTEEPTDPVTPPTLEEPTAPVVPPTTEEPTDPVAPPTTEEPTAPVVPPTLEEPTDSVAPPTPEEPTEPVTPPTLEEPTAPVVPPTTEEPTDPVAPPTTEEPTEPVTPPTLEEPTDPVAPPTPEEPTDSVAPPTLEEPTAPVVPPTTEEPTDSVAPPTTEEPTEPVTPPTIEEPTEPVTPPTLEEPTDSVAPPTTEEPTDPVAPPTTEEPTEPVTPPTLEEPTDSVAPPTPEEPTEPVTPPTLEEPTAPVVPPTPEEPTEPVVPAEPEKPVVEEKVPQVVITNLVENTDAKSATLSYKLTDETTSFRKAVALLYDDTGKLVQEKDIPLADSNGQLTLENLDFYTAYTVKTKIFYTMEGQEQSSEQEAILESMRQFDLIYKKIEIKDVDAVTIYRRKDGKYISAAFLEEIPSDLTELFVKVSSERFKDVYIPVTEVTDSVKDGQAVYKVTTSFEQLVEDNGSQYIQNKIFYIPKIVKESDVYFTFSDLVNAINNNPSGTFKLGADLYADELSIGDVRAYITEPFKGSLTGEHNGSKFAIYNQKVPLFQKVEGATITSLDLKNVNIASAIHTDLGALVNEAQQSTLTDIAVEGNIRGQRNYGGIVYKLDGQSHLTNARFKGKIDSYGTGESYVGGIAGLSTGSYIDKVIADVAIAIKGENNQAAGGIVGRLTGGNGERGINLQNAYATGTITNNGKTNQLGSIVGTNQKGWVDGRIHNVIGNVKGSLAVVGSLHDGNVALQNAYSTQDDTVASKISESDAILKAQDLGVTATVTDSNQRTINSYSVDYLKVAKAQADSVIAYENMEKILPFYNKELLVYYGNKIPLSDKLNKVKLVDVVPMKDGAIVADILADKASINKIMLYFEDGTVDYKSVTYSDDFKNNHIIEYTISDMSIPYTPENFVNQNEDMVNRLVALLHPIAYESESLQKQLNPPATPAYQTTNDINDMYFKSSFMHIKENLASYLRKVLTSSMNGQGQNVENYFEARIADNKEAFLLGLSYLDRWYDINYDQLNTKDLTLFNLDFFGNHSASTLDAIIAIGSAGYEVLRPKNNVATYSTYLSGMTGKSTVFDFVEAYRKVFLPDKTDNQWFKDNTKAYIVEIKSQVAEALEKQNNAEKHSKYAVEVYDKITNPSWRYRQMLLPLLTMPEEDIYILSNMNTISFGAFSRYRDVTNNPSQREEVRNLVDQAAIWQRDHTDFWYKTLNAENKDKMFASYMNTDGFGLFDESGKQAWQDLSSNLSAIQNFFGPVHKWFGSNGTAAYADGSETYFVAYLLLDRVGTSTYTHEMVHNLDSNTLFYGNGRRSGQGAELFAQGLLQSLSSTEDNTIGLNTFYTDLDKKDSLIRVHPYKPVERFTNQEDLNTYAHNMFDAIYLLDYLEGSAVLQQSNEVKKAWFRKIENYYDGVHAGNQIRPLTDEEVAQLTTFNALIDQSIINRRQYYDNAKLSRNGYYNTFLLSPIYSALDNPTGAPGDLMFRRMAYELLAAKGYDEGFIPYVSNHLKSEASNGIVTDTVVLNHIFNNKYATWTEFKKDMYKERIDQLVKLKPFTIVYELDKPNSTQTVTINSYQDLENLMKAAVEEDMKRLSHATSNEATSWVHSLKRKVYSALLRSTDEFRTSIFNP